MLVPNNLQQAPQEANPVATIDDSIIDEDTASMQHIILTFARIAHSFFTIAASKNPKDPVMLGRNLTDMAAGIISIAMEIFRSRPIDEDNHSNTMINISEEDITLIKKVVADMKEQLSYLDSENQYA